MQFYRVLVAKEIFESLKRCSGREKKLILRLFEELADNPFRTGDYIESDEIGRPIQVIICGRRAICFWADHAVKEVKVLDLKPAGN